MKPFTIKKETQPITITSHGSSLNKAFENIAKGMFTYVMNEEEIEPVGQYTINLIGASSQELLLKWISMLQYLHTHHDLVFGYFSVAIENDKQLTGQVFGQKHTPQLGAEPSTLKVVPDSVEITKKSQYKIQASFTK
jgi:SHS2 domain-containing protein